MVVSVNADDSDTIRAVRRLDLDLLTRPVADERLAKGRLIADAAGFGVGLGRADYAIRLLALTVLLVPLSVLGRVFPGWRVRDRLEAL